MNKFNRSQTFKLKVTEADFQATVIKLAQYLGWKVAHFRGVRVLRANGNIRYQTPVQGDGKGFPDLVLVRRARIIYAELKSESGKLSPEQQEWLKALAAAGGEVYIWRLSDWQEIQEVLTRELPPNKLEELAREV
ncbi:MAG: VRR-NUC domain-containing protein [Dehalococcoidales bacterium]|nr:VRR-NUC domain-containing protein [Dehalococcoidales bacterium]